MCRSVSLLRHFLGDSICVALMIWCSAVQGFNFSTAYKFLNVPFWTDGFVNYGQEVTVVLGRYGSGIDLGIIAFSVVKLLKLLIRLYMCSHNVCG